MATESPFTVKQFLGNTPGKYTRQVAARYMIKDHLNSLFLKQYKDYKKDFKAFVHKKANDLFRIHIKVPSSTHPKVKFDVIFDFDFSDTALFQKAGVRVFTNSPAWVFTYAFVFNQHDDIPADLIDYITHKAITEPPKITNPKEDAGFEKITYFAMLYIQYVMLIRTKGDFLKFVSSSKEDLSEIKNLQTDEKMREYNEAKFEAVENKRAERAEAKAHITIEKKSVGGKTRSYSNGRRVANQKAVRVAKPPRTGRKPRQS